MLDVLFWILIGAFIGWSIPQPEWAAKITNKIKHFVGK